MGARPTIADIAKELGVSPSTVSRALRDHPAISESRKQEVRAAAEALGFEVKPAPGIVLGAAAPLVACIVPSLSHPFMSSFVERLEAEAASLGYNLLVANSGGSPTTEKTIVDGLIARRVDGVFFIPTSFESTSLAACRAVLTTVIVTQISPEWPSIGTSHEEGGALVAEHFMEQSRSSCLFIGPRQEEKFQGFRNYLTARRVTGFRFEHLVADGWDADLSVGVQEAILARYDADSIRQFDCVFGNNDIVAIGALHALQDLGVSIPSEIAVCGFDDTPLAREVRPGLTSVAQSLGQMVRSAFFLLLRVKAEEAIPPGERCIRLKPHLVVRGSTFAGP